MNTTIYISLKITWSRASCDLAISLKADSKTLAILSKLDWRIIWYRCVRHVRWQWSRRSIEGTSLTSFHGDRRRITPNLTFIWLVVTRPWVLIGFWLIFVTEWHSVANISTKWFQVRIVLAWRRTALWLALMLDHVFSDNYGSVVVFHLRISNFGIVIPRSWISVWLFLARSSNPERFSLRPERSKMGIILTSVWRLLLRSSVGHRFFLNNCTPRPWLNRLYREVWVIETRRWITVRFELIFGSHVHVVEFGSKWS